MNIRKICISCVAVLGMLASVSACGSNSAGVTDTKKDKGLPVMGEALKYNPNHLVNQGKPIALEYWSWGDSSTDPIYDMIKQYTKIYPNVTFKTKNVAWDDYWTKLPLALKGKSGPALFNIHNSKDELIRPYAADYNVDKAAMEADYSSSVAHEDSNGKVKYIDSVINTGNIYYNKKLWKEAGLTEADIPTTWDELREVAKKLTKWNGSKMVQAGFNVNGDAYAAINQGLNYQRGELAFDKSGKKPNFDNKITREHMQFLKNLYDKDKVIATDFGTDYTLGVGLKAY